MDAQRYWFEEVPEQQRYWFLVPWGPSRRQAEQEDAELAPELKTQLRDNETDVQAERVFGTTGDRIRETRKEGEEVRRRMNAVGYGYSALSVPWWPDARKWVHQQDPEYVQAPMLFSTKEAAEKERRSLEATEPELYLRLKEQYEEEYANEVFDNTPSLRVMWIDWGGLLDMLEDSDFLCVMVNHKLKLRQDFAEELRKQLGVLEEEEKEE